VSFVCEFVAFIRKAPEFSFTIIMGCKKIIHEYFCSLLPGYFRSVNEVAVTVNGSVHCMMTIVQPFMGRRMYSKNGVTGRNPAKNCL
jgi:hypothetical protein